MVAFDGCLHPSARCRLARHLAAASFAHRTLATLAPSRGAGLQVDGAHAFELPLPEVGEVQGQRDEAILEFHVDDGAASVREDALCAVTFVIPDGNETFLGARGGC